MPNTASDIEQLAALEALYDIFLNRKTRGLATLEIPPASQNTPREVMRRFDAHMGAHRELDDAITRLINAGYNVPRAWKTVDVFGSRAAVKDSITGSVKLKWTKRPEKLKAARVARDIYFAIEEMKRTLETAIKTPGGSPPALEVSAQASEAVKPDPIAMAVAIKKDHPEWSDRKIAKSAGCSPTKLCRDDFYQRVKQNFAAERDRPKGTKDGKTGRIEAESDG